MPCKARLTGRRDRYGEVPFDRSISSHYHRSQGDDNKFARRREKPLALKMSLSCVSLSLPRSVSALRIVAALGLEVGEWA